MFSEASVHGAYYRYSYGIHEFNLTWRLDMLETVANDIGWFCSPILLMDTIDYVTTIVVELDDDCRLEMIKELSDALTKVNTAAQGEVESHIREAKELVRKSKWRTSGRRWDYVMKKRLTASRDVGVMGLLPDSVLYCIAEHL